MVASPLPSIARRLFYSSRHLWSYTLLPLALLGLFLAPEDVAAFLPWISLALALLLLGRVMLLPNPTKLVSVPNTLVALTLLRLTADLSGHAFLFGSEPSAELCGTSWKLGPHLWLLAGLLVVFQLVVILIGHGQASQLSQVHARFQLYVLPGRNMAIDADQFSGQLNDREAQIQRSELTRGANFFDFLGRASKFSTLDAWISIVLLGAMSWQVWGYLNQLDGRESIGHLLVHSLITTVCSAILHTTLELTRLKALRAENIVERGPQAPPWIWNLSGWSVMSAAVAWVFSGGRPPVPVMVTAFLFGAWMNHLRRTGASTKTPPLESCESVSLPPPADVPVVELGLSLLGPLADPRNDAPLLAKICAVRDAMAKELGFLVPSVRIRCNLTLPPREYRILVHGRVESSWELRLDRLMALGPEKALRGLVGKAVKEPAFGLLAVWVEPVYESQGAPGCLLVAPLDVLASDLAERLRRHAGELLTREEVRARAQHQGLTPTSYQKLQSIRQVLSALLDEEFPLHGLDVLFEKLSSGDVESNVAAVRRLFPERVCSRLADSAGDIPVISIEGTWERELVGLEASDDADQRLRPSEVARLLALANLAQETHNRGVRPVFLATAALRYRAARQARRFGLNAVFIAREEVARGYRLRVSLHVGSNL